MRRSISVLLVVLGSMAWLSLPGYAQSDTTSPVLGALSVDPVRVDATTSDQMVVATAVITDDLSGVCDDTCTHAHSQMWLISPSGAQSVGTCCLENVSGDTYTITLTFPQYSEEGIWQVGQVYLSDNAGNDTVIQQAALITNGINVAVAVGAVDATYDREIHLTLSRNRATGMIEAGSHPVGG